VQLVPADPPRGWLFKVITAIDDTPASKAGIKAGDIITGLNGKTTQGLSPDDARSQMRGRPDTMVTLTSQEQVPAACLRPVA